MRGIYSITNKANGKIYIGQSSNLKKRKREHFTLLRAGKHENSYLQRAFNKYGEENFIFEILVLDNEVSDEDLDILERMYVMLFETHLHTGGKGYNLAIGGRTRRGFRHTEETRSKMSKARTSNGNAFYGKSHSDETKEKIAIKLRGRSVPQSERDKISKAMKGRKFSDEHRKKKSDAQRGGKNPIAKKVSVEGKIYDCIQEAADVYSLRHNTVSYRINSTSDKFRDWFYLET